MKVPIPSILLERAWALECRAKACWGQDAQRLMVCEEAGELVSAIAQHARGRATAQEVVDEAADAIIVACAAVAVVDLDLVDLEQALRAKLDRLQSRVNDHDRKKQQMAIAAMHNGRENLEAGK